MYRQNFLLLGTLTSSHLSIIMCIKHICVYIIYIICVYNEVYTCAVLSCVWLFVAPQTVARWSPCSWSFPGKNTGVGYHFLLQGIFAGIKPVSVSCTDSRFFTTRASRCFDFILRATGSTKELFCFVWGREGYVNILFVFFKKSLFSLQCEEHFGGRQEWL